MPDQTEKVLLELRLNAEQLKSELGTVRDKTKELRSFTKEVTTELTRLAESGQKGTAEYAELLNVLGDNERQLVGLTRAAQELNKNLDAVEAASGSFNKLAAETAFLEKQLKAADVGVNITAEGYELLAKKVNDGMQAQRDFARNVSNNNRELVGSYAESLGPALDNIAGKVQAANDSVLALGQQLAEARAKRDTLSPLSAEAAEATNKINQLEQALAAAKVQLDSLDEKNKVTAGSLADLENKLNGLLEKRRNAVGEQLQEINTQILVIRGAIGEASGKFDEFGDRIEKNAKREDIATLGDAFGGVAASINVVTLLLGNNEKATKAAEAATKALAIAQSIRSIQIGIASAKDAAAIIITGAKNLFLKAEVTAQTEAAAAAGVHAAATVADTAATEASVEMSSAATVAAAGNAEATVAEAEAAGVDAVAQTARAEATGAAVVASEASAAASTTAAGATAAQTVATEAATVATEGLTTALVLNPIGAIIVLILALVGGLFAYSRASDSTKQKVEQFIKVLFYVTTPVGALVGLLELLYNKFELVRTSLDPLLAGLAKVGDFIKVEAIAVGRYIGLLDTAAEAAVKAADKAAKATADRAGLYEAEAKLLELAGAKLNEYREKERAGIVASYNAERDKLLALKALRDEQLAAGKKRSVEEIAALTEQAVKVRQLAATLGQYDRETSEQHIALLQKELAARSSSIEAQLELVRVGSAEELALQKQRLELQYLSSISVARLTVAERTAIEAKYNADSLKLDRDYLQARRAAYLNNQGSDIAARLEVVRLGGKQELALLEQQLRTQRDASLNNYNLSAADRAAIERKYQADKLKLDLDFARAGMVADIENQQSRVNAKLAVVAKGTQAEYDLQLAAINTETQLSLAQLDRRRNNTAKEIEIRAAGLAKINQLDAQFLDQALARNAERLSQEKASTDAALNLMGSGLNAGQRQQLEASAGYANTRREQILGEARVELAAINASAAQRRFAALGDKQLLAQIDKDAAAQKLTLEQNTAAALLNLDAETNEKRKKLATDRAAVVLGLTKTALDDIGTLYDIEAQQATDDRNAREASELAAVGNNAAQQKVIKDKFAKQAARDEAEAAEKRKKLQIAQALVNGALAITQILAAPAAPFVEPFATIVRGVQIGLVVASTAAQIAAMKSAKFARGGVVEGPSHAAGGVQLYHKSGAHLGEMEGDETILVPGVARSPLLRSLASTLNVLAGGRSFANTTSTSAGQLSKFVAGGVVTFDPALTSGRSGGSALAPLTLNYAELAEHLAPVLTDAVSALPPSKLVLSELDEAKRKITYTEQQADNT